MNVAGGHEAHKAPAKSDRLPKDRRVERAPGMRLNEADRQAIKAATEECFGPDASVRLFGSRSREDRRGGDIDLLVETRLLDANRVSRAHTLFLARLQDRLGEQKIDVLIDYPGRNNHPPIYAIARREGVLL